jgi:hypothetical protein
MVSEIEIAVPRSDIIFLHRVIDGAYAELEAAVADGDVDESVLIELDEALNCLKEFLQR